MNLKVYKKMVALVLSGTMVLSMAGCSKKPNYEEDNKNSLLVTGYNDETVAYDYVIDYSGFVSEQLETKEDSNKYEIAALVNEENKSSSTFKTKMTTGFYNAHRYYIIPSSLQHYNSTFTNDKLSENIYIEKRYRTTDEDEIKVIQSGVVFKMNASDFYYKDKPFSLLEGIEAFEGDSIMATAVLLNGELVAFKQEGIGSDCENIIPIGDVDSVVKNLDEFISLEEDTYVRPNEAHVMTKSINK